MRRLLTIAILLCSYPSWAANCFAHVSTHGTATSPSMDTTGATILVAVVASYSGFVEVLSDNVGTRDWQTSQEYDPGGTGGGQFGIILYKPAPVTNAAYTFNIPNPGNLFFLSATMWACNGVTTDHPLRQQVGIATLGTTGTGQIAPVTPQNTGDLVFTAGVVNSSSVVASVDSGFSTAVVNNSTGNLASLSSWLSAPNTSSLNPTWTWTPAASAEAPAMTAIFAATGATPLPDVGQHISSPVGTGFPGFAGDGGPATNAFTNYPGELVGLSNGLICFVDVNNNRVRCFNPTAGTLTPPYLGSPAIAPGNIDTIAGSTLGFVYNVPPLSAHMAHPSGLAVDSSNCLYIADQQNSRILKMCPGGNLVVIAGGDNGGGTNTGCLTGGGSDPVAAGFAGDGGLATAALLRCPQSVRADAAGNVYIGDTNNDRVRVVNTQGTTQTLLGVSICAGCIRTVLGQGTHGCTLTGSGITTSAAWPIGIDLDASGNLYVGVIICASVWKVTTAGVPSVVAGNPTLSGYSGDGGLATSATMRTPFRLNIAPNGDYYITDTGNSVIRFVDHTTHIISTIAGNYNFYPYYAPTTWNSGAYCCDGGAANVAGLAYPIGLHYDSVNNFLYISDLVNSRVRKLFTVSPTGVGSQITGNSQWTAGSQVR